MPLPLTRSTVPGWVPAGIFIVVLLSSVGTSISAPGVARTEITGNSPRRSSPAPWKYFVVSAKQKTIQAPRGPAAKPRFTVAGGAQARTAFDAGGNPQLDF